MKKNGESPAKNISHAQDLGSFAFWICSYSKSPRPLSLQHFVNSGVLFFAQQGDKEYPCLYKIYLTNSVPNMFKCIFYNLR